MNDPARAQERRLRQRLEQAVLLDAAITAIAAVYAAGLISASQAAELAVKATVRAQTMHLMLGFPLEERMN